MRAALVGRRSAGPGRWASRAGHGPFESAGPPPRPGSGPGDASPSRCEQAIFKPRREDRLVPGAGVFRGPERPSVSPQTRLSSWAAAATLPPSTGKSRRDMRTWLHTRPPASGHACAPFLPACYQTRLPPLPPPGGVALALGDGGLWPRVKSAGDSAPPPAGCQRGLDQE